MSEEWLITLNFFFIMMMQCFLLAVNYFKHYNNYTTDQIISLISAVQHLHYEINQSFLRLCFIGGRVGKEERLFLDRTSVVAN